jgi:glutaminase
LYRVAPNIISVGPLRQALAQIHQQLSSLDRGEVATYIPELAKANPKDFAISIATVEGNIYQLGDHEQKFSIQSISKPFVYGLALGDNGVERVNEKVDVEPSGEAFNAISLEPGTGRPRNPMINAGAITATSLVAGSSQAEKLERTLAMLGAYAGRELEIDEHVFLSERQTGHRNRAIGHLLRNAGILVSDVDEVVDRYFSQCSVRVTCDDLALMAATLANGGQNPLTGAVAVQPDHVQRVLSVMSTCGMYDSSGSWMFRVGMPAKSGVAGGVIAILPGQLGIGVYSPRLDAFGNSVRGVAVCEALSARFGLHMVSPPVSPSSVVRGVFSLGEVASKRQRSAEDLSVLAKSGRSVRLFQLQGPLVFSSAEVVLQKGIEECQRGRTLIFDFQRVEAIDRSVPHLFRLFVREAAAIGTRTLFAGCNHPGFQSELGSEDDVICFPSADRALERCEDELLSPSGVVDSKRSVPLEAHPLLRSLSSDEVALVRSLATRVEFEPGQRIVSRGELSDSLFLVVSGAASVNLPLPDGRRHRVSALGPGSVFGEMALLDRGARTADVDADTHVSCYKLGTDPVLSDLPVLRSKIIVSLAQQLAHLLRRTNQEIAALAP